MGALTLSRRSFLAAAAIGLSGSARAAKPPAAAAAPRPLVLPAPLRNRLARAEASGIAWAPTLDRYLVIIDDTIVEDDPRAPLVLALNREGRFDDDPVPIDGVIQLDDAESICAAGPRRFFLLTSHSPNRHGRVRAARRQLLDLTLEGRVLKVSRRADLSEGKGGVPRVLRATGVDVDELGGFDAEAVAFHDDALYVGLKAPLSPADGSALVLRIDDPDNAFDRGRVHKGHLRLWATLRLAVPGTSGQPVGQGISDMLFSPDGTLYLTANAPKGGAADGGGALWCSRRPQQGGHLAPELLQRFARLKPEGLSLNPDGTALAVVFDRDDATPLWTSWPLRS